MPAVTTTPAPLPEPEVPLRPLGRREHAFWILSQLAPGSGVSHLTVAFRTVGTLRWWPLHAAANHLLYRHPALRTRYPQKAGVPLRHLSAATDVQLLLDTRAVAERDVEAVVAQLARHPFDLATELPLRVALLNVDTGGSVVVLSTHHIVSDAASLTVLVRELSAGYDAVAAGDPVPAALAGPLPLRDEPEVPADDLGFWREQLRDVDPAAMVLSWARPSPVNPTFAGGTVTRRLSPDAARAVDALRRQLRLTENLVLLTGYHLLLFRHGAGPDMVVGVPVTVRKDGDAGIGLGISTLPLRLRVDRALSFRQLARQVRDAFLAGVMHSGASAEALLAELGHRSADWRAPLFRHLFNYRPWDESDVRIAGEKPTFLDVLRAESRLDIELSVIGGTGPGTLVATYSAEVHDREDVEALLERLEQLLIEAAADVDRPVGLLSLCSAADRAVLARANDTATGPRRVGTAPEMIMAVARARPDAVALAGECGSLTYRQLVARGGQVARALGRAGVGTGDVVGLALGRTTAMVASMLGVWGVGAAYLPLDPDQPPERLRYLVEDAGARAVIVGSGDAGWAAGRPVLRWPDLEPAGGPPDRPPDGPLAVVPDRGAARADEAAYVIYTSGSTGRPKGVAVSHGSLANVVLSFADLLGTTERDPVLWSTTVTFDISALELFLPLVRGGRVVVAAERHGLDVVDLITGQDVHVVQGTPTFWRAVLPEAAGALAGRTVLCGGEPLAAELARDLKRTGCRLFNAYGPTETTIWSTVAEVPDEPAGPVSVGAPVANTQVFIVDGHGVELPRGIPGELCIAGAGVAIGYLGRPDLTAQRFGTHPAFGRFYRTGDVARWRHDGALELLGRQDRQVKLRGHRIELGEVESVLREADGVTDAVAVVTGDRQGQGRLHAFVRVGPGVAVPQLPERLWRYLRDRLPDYSLPSGIAVLDAFPVTPNRKTDHRALAERVAAADHPGVPAPPEDDGDLTELTTALVDLWREALVRPGLGADDNFFLHGGQSLLALGLLGRVRALVGREVPVRAIFDHPTARQLARALSAGDRHVVA